MTRTTNAAVFVEAGKPFEFREVPLPKPSGAEVLTEVIACTLCGSDLHSLRGRRTVPTPTILGHEILGRVAEFGPSASRQDAAGHPLRIGDRITWAVVANCGECFYCRRSLPQKCERRTKYGHEPLHPGRELTGGLAGHCLLAPGTALFRVPDDLPDATACPANCATATVAAAIEAAGPLAGARVLVMGAGMLGVTTSAWARSLGAERVIVCDTEPTRLDLASTFGATDTASPEELADVVLDRTGVYGLDVAFEMTGSPESFETLLPQMRLGGTIVLIGSVFPSRPVLVSLERIVIGCLTLRGLHNYAPRHLRMALEFLASNRDLPFESLVDGWHPLASLDHVLLKPAPPGTLRVGLRP